MKKIWMDAAVWVGTVVAAVAFAVAAPKGLAVLGRLPAFSASNLNNQPVMIPEGLKAERTLLLLNFKRDQGRDIESWIVGLRLREDPNLAWLRMPVLSDTGPLTRTEVEGRLLAHYTKPDERAMVVPVFTDRASFLKGGGMTRTDTVYAVVINRQGEVLARSEGPFDDDKGRIMRDTLLVERRL